jgi:hypothetical protein
VAKSKENSKKYIVSCRVNDDEMSLLKQRARQNGVSITQLLRSCLDFVEQEQRRQLPERRKYACG